jgi:hypothetical protein
MSGDEPPHFTDMTMTPEGAGSTYEWSDRGIDTMLGLYKPEIEA